MPLFDNNTPWPPAEQQPITEAMRIWDAWYTGDPDALRAVYQRVATRPPTRASQLSGGVVGAVSRWWWGKPTDATGSVRQQLHVPLAADICQASADLLYSEPPTLSLDDTQGEEAQQRLDDLASDGLFATLAEQAEVAAALGGAYLRVAWDDKVVPDGPFLTVLHADNAIPEWRWGRLVAVTFWWTLKDDGQQVLRRLERHELNADGVGIVLHGLYQGTADNLGIAVPLADSAATAALADLVDDQGAISTLTPGLAVVYVPNLRPQRRWRRNPAGTNLGRSDLDGVEPLMDALDATWSSLMRDIDLAKARLIVPEFMLDSDGPGRGTTFDIDREIFSPVKALGEDAGLASQIVAQQFAIRVEEHIRAADELIHQILRTCGYSLATFGVGEEAGVATATEVNARQQRSDLTRDRKIRLQRPAVQEILAKLLTVDGALFGGPVTVIKASDIDVVFSDGIQDSPLELAQTVQALKAAEAASRKVRVQIVHPDWDEQQVDEEVKLIEAEASANDVPDPAGFLPAGATSSPSVNADPAADPSIDTAPAQQAG